MKNLVWILFIFNIAIFYLLRPQFEKNKTKHECLVLLCDQNSFGRSKMVLVWPNWFGLDHNDLVTTKMKWSRPKWIGQVQMWFILVENHNLDLTNSFWSWPNHYGQVQINLVRPKPFWTNQNCFGRIEGQGISRHPGYPASQREVLQKSMAKSKSLGQIVKKKQHQWFFLPVSD